MDEQLAPYQAAYEYRKTLIEVPRELTAENGAKAVLIGEFFEEIPNPEYDEDYCSQCEAEDCDCIPSHIQVPVMWTTIKKIWQAAVKHFEASDATTESKADEPRSEKE